MAWDAVMKKTKNDNIGSIITTGFGLVGRVIFFSSLLRSIKEKRKSLIRIEEEKVVN